MVTAAASVGIVGIAFVGYAALPALKWGIAAMAGAGIASLAYVQWNMLHPETRRRILSLLHLPAVLNRSKAMTPEPLATVETAIH